MSTYLHLKQGGYCAVGFHFDMGHR